MVLILKLCKFN